MSMNDAKFVQPNLKLTLASLGGLAATWHPTYSYQLVGSTYIRCDVARCGALTHRGPNKTISSILLAPKNKVITPDGRSPRAGVSDEEEH
jgi:hypothetical protein